MARPRKNNADYFPHDNNMRSHRKMIALRNKFWLTWYAIYNMLLEHIASCDFFVSKRDELEKEIVSWDFGVSVAELEDIISFCGRLNLVQIEWETLKCESLWERLSHLIEKRERERDRVSVTETTQVVTESPHSKVKNSKEKKRKEKDIPKFLVRFIELKKEKHQVAKQIKNKGLDNYQLVQLAEYEKLIKKWYTDEEVKKVLTVAVKDDFWSEQILTIWKLNKKNKEWNLYIDVLLDKFTSLTKKK